MAADLRSSTAAPALRRSTRALLAVFALLSLLALASLFGQAERTDRWFAWTIAPPVTAAFLGAAYGAGAVIEILALRSSTWRGARGPFLAVLVFVLLSLVATVLHGDRFHYGDPDPVARGAAWLWLAVYVVVPVAMVATLVVEARAARAAEAEVAQRGERDARVPIPPVLRAALAVQGAVLVGVGAALFVAPGSASALWAWPLTPLTARAVGAWLVGLGVAVAIVVRDSDLRWDGGLALAYATFGALQLVVVVRFADAVAWDRPAAAGLVVLLVAVLVTGLAGWWVGRVRGGPA